MIKNNKDIYIIICAIISLGIGIYIYSLRFTNFSNKHNDIYLKKEFHGKVIGKKKSKNNSTILVLKGGKEILLIPQFVCYIEIGDSIYKNSGDSIAYIYNGNRLEKKINYIEPSKIVIENSNDNNKLTPEEIINYFYENIENPEKLDNIISFRFYQKTPYNRFKEIIIFKNNHFGKLIEKNIIKTEYSDDGISISYFIKVKYENLEANEQIIMIKESKKDNFSIYEYNVKQNFK
ncbi:hypothetical protein LXD69_04835 [Flavobacterium sediminilitoris]|uniref:Uncharacterized protein n=1 Tax=Flavobacterium sediminilitoris TaxID=2024526 RepID=A0ABY4HRN0_9FLAO|nr:MULTISPECIES: hypothetical protein [Flavobacterium]UOX34837.1 hypothetical protein LXD69_04835 [Flavobacterium sediminilitoris]